jgi:hypothetical protein
MIAFLKGEESPYGFWIGIDPHAVWNISAFDGSPNNMLGDALGSQTNLPQAFRDTPLGPRVGSPPHGNPAAR